MGAHYGCPFLTESTKLLLEYYRDVAYMKDTKGRTALHIAACRGHHMVVENIISSCPDCCELVDNRGRNALHFAAEGHVGVPYDFEVYYENIRLIINVILDNRSLGNLLNQKDADGNTPLHNFLQRSSYWLDTNNHWMDSGIKYLFSDPRVDQMAFNNENLHAWDTALTAADHQSTRKSLDLLKEVAFTPNGRVPEVDEKIEKFKHEKIMNMKKLEETTKKLGFMASDEDIRSQAANNLLVAALITTVTFTAGITMPGGFVGGGETSQPAGSAILRTSAAFKAFVITDVLAMVLSTSAIFLNMFLAYVPSISYDLYDARMAFHRLAFLILLSSMIPMVLAFITGTYAVLAHSLDVAIPACIIGLSFFPMVIFLFKLLLIMNDQALKAGSSDYLSSLV